MQRFTFTITDPAEAARFEADLRQAPKVYTRDGAGSMHRRFDLTEISSTKPTAGARERKTLNAFEQRTLEYLTNRLSSGTAVSSKTLTYQELARAMDPDINPRDRRFKRLAGALHQINLHEADHGRPLPGAMVVRASDGMPGEGFYWSAQEAGREFDASPAPNGHHVGPTAIAYWRKELADLIEYWSGPDGAESEKSQLDRIEAKLDRVINNLAAKPRS